MQKMTGNEFIQQGQQIAGVKRGWQVLIAFRLKISLRSVKRYASGKRKVPATVAELMRVILDSEK
jgi:hypothetical protein